MRRRQRGSICLYVAVILIAMGFAIAALVPLATNLRERTTRRADEAKARMAFEAGVATVESKSLDMTLVLGTSLPVSVNGVTGTVTPSVCAWLTNALLVQGTMVRNGQSYRYIDVVGARQPSPFLFALMSKSDVTSLKKVTLGANGWGGDAFSDGKFNLNGSGGTVNGNLGAVTTVGVQSGTVVTGQTLTGQTAIAWPTLTASNYSNAAIAQISSGNGLLVYTSTTLNSIVFPSWSFSTGYAMYYYGSNLAVSGTITGRGTIYVAGSLTISGNLRYASSSDEIAFVVAGGISVGSSVDTIDGYYFSNGTLSDSKGLTVSRGAIVANAFGTDKDLTIVRDDAVMNDTNEAVRLRLPYYWP